MKLLPRATGAALCLTGLLALSGCSATGMSIPEQDPFKSPAPASTSPEMSEEARQLIETIVVEQGKNPSKESVIVSDNARLMRYLGGAASVNISDMGTLPAGQYVLSYTCAGSGKIRATLTLAQHQQKTVEGECSRETARTYRTAPLTLTKPEAGYQVELAPLNEQLKAVSWQVLSPTGAKIVSPTTTRSS